jgi:hypothetical protein
VVHIVRDLLNYLLFLQLELLKVSFLLEKMYSNVKIEGISCRSNICIGCGRLANQRHVVSTRLQHKVTIEKTASQL